MPMGLRTLTHLATWLAPPRRTARRRLTVMYVVLFLVSGVLLLGITGTLAVSSSSEAVHSGPHLPPQSALSQADAQIAQLQGQLAHATNAAQAQAHHQLL